MVCLIFSCLIFSCLISLIHPAAVGEAADRRWCIRIIRRRLLCAASQPVRTRKCGVFVTMPCRVSTTADTHARQACVYVGVSGVLPVSNSWFASQTPDQPSLLAAKTRGAIRLSLHVKDISLFPPHRIRSPREG